MRSRSAACSCFCCSRRTYQTYSTFTASRPSCSTSPRNARNAGRIVLCQFLLILRTLAFHALLKLSELHLDTPTILVQFRVAIFLEEPIKFFGVGFRSVPLLVRRLDFRRDSGYIPVTLHFRPRMGDHNKGQCPKGKGGTNEKDGQHRWPKDRTQRKNKGNAQKNIISRLHCRFYSLSNSFHYCATSNISFGLQLH